MQNFKDLVSKILVVRSNINERQESFLFRKEASENTNTFVKLAFDTRKFNSETDFISRRNLQNYNRSEQFISEGMNLKLKNFKKLYDVVLDIFDLYGKTPEWQDSYARILKNNLDKTFRSEINDDEHSESQKSLGSLNYLMDLIYVRYRITIDDLKDKTNDELKKIILKKDSELYDAKPEKITKHDVAVSNYGDLLEKLFGGVKADKNNPNVERTVTITIKDRLVEDGE